MNENCNENDASDAEVVLHEKSTMRKRLSQMFPKSRKAFQCGGQLIDSTLAECIASISVYFASWQILGNSVSAALAFAYVRAYAGSASAFDTWNVQSGVSGVDIATLRRATLLLFGVVMLFGALRLFRGEPGANSARFKIWRTSFWRRRRGWVLSWFVGAIVATSTFPIYEYLRLRTVIVAGDETYFLPIILPSRIQRQLEQVRREYPNDCYSHWATGRSSDAKNMKSTYPGHMVFTTGCYVVLQGVSVAGMILMIASPVTRRTGTPEIGDLATILPAVSDDSWRSDFSGS